MEILGLSALATVVLTGLVAGGTELVKRVFDADGPEITFTYYNNTTYAKSQSVKVTVTDMSAINTSS